MGRAELEEYRRIRKEGGRSQHWKQRESNEIYDEVTEDQYSNIVKSRLARDDFVVDDGVAGYMDDGMDDWEDQTPHEDASSRRNLPAKKADKKKQKPTTSEPSISQSSYSSYRPTISAEKEQLLLDGILGDLNVTTVQPSRAPLLKRKPEPSPNSSSPNHYSFDDVPANDVSSDDNDSFMQASKRQRLSSLSLAPAVEHFSSLKMQSDDSEFDHLLEDDNDGINGLSDFDLAVPPDDHDTKPVAAAEPHHSSDLKDDPPKWLNLYASLKVQESDELGPLSDSKPREKVPQDAILEDDGTFRFFWLDYLELDGKVFLVGKSKSKKTGSWLSCVLIVDGIERNLFVLPRQDSRDDDDENSEQTKDCVESDFEAIRKKAGVRSYAAKWVRRGYVFGDKNIPTGESEWLKVVYGFDQPQITSDVNSPNITTIMGTNTSAFEVLVLKRKIMGPCWLQVKNPEISAKNISWCQCEVRTSSPKDISPILDGDDNAAKDIPPLNIMSISLRSIVNHVENRREIVCASVRVWSNAHIDDPTPPEQLPCTAYTFVRPLDRFPKDFELAAQRHTASRVITTKNERMLLNSLLAKIHNSDPDVIVGHEFLGVQLDILLHRMQTLKTDHWSRIGRFRRAKWPKIGRQGMNMKFLSGRLLCDLSGDAGKSMIASTTWSLTEMCSTHLQCERQDIDPDDTATYFDGSLGTPDRLMAFIRHTEMDSHFQAAIASKVQIIPLTRQLTNLAGNSWNRTLNSGRAERNEYILLHEFHRLKYVCPDKRWQRRNVKASLDTEETEGTKSKKDKYKGGLVFEPKRGLWDTFILVMDFNSLYPSIIQEYNIDFTTVARREDDEDCIPEPPSTDVPQGVLPRLIATLVRRRKQVKGLMKERNIPPFKMLQYDIKQQALKLTANSMYGCLGFENSRFYARPLAALTTFKGREILTHTRELAESLNLDVVYGDTDSVFVNSNVTDLASALKVANDFKKHVNDRYKLLEIDLDSIFQRLLLLQKKKYAAVKIEDSQRTTTEIKGLDMKRREYCNLSKSISNYVLTCILSGEVTEIVVEQIHDYLRTIGSNVRSGSTPLEDFVINKRLGKNPEDYPDAKSQPHVQVALRLKKKGTSARAGDVIPYVFCLDESGHSSKSAQADRAYHPDELRKSGSELKLDFDYYLSQQILPPIERLCDCIEGTDKARLAECLGLDPSRFKSSGTTLDENPFGSLESQIPDSEKFKNASPFTVRCRSCKAEFTFSSVSDLKPQSGLLCPNEECATQLDQSSLQSQLLTQIRHQVARYYDALLVCDDPTCGYRTRRMSVYGRRCLRPGCRGNVGQEYSDVSLYNQLMYFSSLFDSVKILDKARGSPRYGEVQIFTSMQQEFLTSMLHTVGQFLKGCGRQWVELDSLFSFMTT